MEHLRKKLSAVIYVRAGIASHGDSSSIGAGKALKGLDLRALSEQVQITMTPEGLVIDFVERAGSVFFESGSAIIRPEARAIILKVAKVLGGSKRYMRIEGHTDAKPYASTDYDNWDLSGDRANAMRRLLVSGGVSDWQVLRVEGLADRDPKVKNDPFNFANRRVTILLPFDNTNPSTVTDKNQVRVNDQVEFNRDILIRPATVEPDQKKTVNDQVHQAVKTLVETGHRDLVRQSSEAAAAASDSAPPSGGDTAAK